jgi:ABC-type transporter MlaC component
VKQIFETALLLAAVLIMTSACDSKKDPVASGREAVKEVVTQPFNTLESAKDSLKQSEDKSKTALEELEKESKQ